jgi:hypothetical protein
MHFSSFLFHYQGAGMNSNQIIAIYPSYEVFDKAISGIAALMGMAFTHQTDDPIKAVFSIETKDDKITDTHKVKLTSLNPCEIPSKRIYLSDFKSTVMKLQAIGDVRFFKPTRLADENQIEVGSIVMIHVQKDNCISHEQAAEFNFCEVYEVVHIYKHPLMRWLFGKYKFKSLIADERTVEANDLSISTGPSFFPGGSVDYYILDKVDYSTLI